MWYIRSPISHNLLSSMMKRLSLQAKLSKSNTNHCLRATTIVHLKEAGVDEFVRFPVIGIRLLLHHMIVLVLTKLLSAAIDSKHVPETSVAICHSDAAHAFSKATKPAASHSSFTLVLLVLLSKMSPSMSLQQRRRRIDSLYCRVMHDKCNHVHAPCIISAQLSSNN